MKPRIPLLCALFAASAVLQPAIAQVAITEFFANPSGLPDSEGEFVELFNFGSETVNLNGWRISDEDSDSDPISESDLLMEPGDYVVLAKNKAALETAFFDGESKAGIIDLTGLTLKNGADEIILTDADAELVWSIAYPSGEANGSACFLSEDDIATAVWGSKESPGIDFTDIDPASGTLSYQNNNTTTDPHAITTDAGDTASPLAGHYTAGGGPVDPEDGFRILSIVLGADLGSYDITFTSELGADYALDQSPDLSDGSFVEVALAVATGDTTTVTTDPGDIARAFYRIRRTPPAVDP